MSTYDNPHNNKQELITEPWAIRSSVRIKLSTRRIIGFVMTVVPLVLIVVDFSILSWFLLGLIPIGSVMFYRSRRTLNKENWRASHPSYTSLNQHEVSYSQWDSRTQDIEENRFNKSRIERVYYGRHDVKDIHLYLEKDSEEVFALPVIHFIYDQNMKRRAHSVSFLYEKDAERWMELLSSMEVPLIFTSEITTDTMSEAEMLDKLLNDRGQQKFVFHRGVDDSFYNYLESVNDEFNQAYENGTLAPEEEEEFLRRVREHKEKERNSSALLSVGPGWFIFVLQWGAAYYMGLKAMQGEIDAEHWLTPSIVVMGLSMLFYLLVRRLLWPQILIYMIGSFINLMIASSVLEGLNSSEVAAEMYASLYSSVILCSVLLWIPYVLIYPFKLGKRERGIRYERD
ncbi:hypothetical protein [Paenibacillus sp. FSL R5-0519]|uniref:hypothetical protein n=1 Tax=Paenibacillus sp. FSL R5-0519 TaxID=2921648 RepID=UPI0030DCBAA0